MKKILVIIVVFQLTLSYNIAQNVSTTDHERYWYYRNRLKYFVKLGDQQGERMEWNMEH